MQVLFPSYHGRSGYETRKAGSSSQRIKDIGKMKKEKRGIEHKRERKEKLMSKKTMEGQEVIRKYVTTRSVGCTLYVEEEK